MKYLFLTLFILFSCAHKANMSQYPALYNSKPRICVILPLDNKTSYEELSLEFQREVYEIMKSLKWKVIPYTNTNKILEQKYKIDDGAELKGKNKNKITSALNADGLVFLYLTEFDLTQSGMNKRVEIELSIEIYNGIKNQLLWSSSQRCVDEKRPMSASEIVNSTSELRSKMILKNCIEKLLVPLPYYN